MCAMILGTGRGDGSVGKTLTAQAQGPAFESQHPHKPVWSPIRVISEPVRAGFWGSRFSEKLSPKIEGGERLKKVLRDLHLVNCIFY